jgi:hypothetical protein
MKFLSRAVVVTFIFFMVARSQMVYPPGLCDLPLSLAQGVTYPTVWEESLALPRLPIVKELTAELHDFYS